VIVRMPPGSHRTICGLLASRAEKFPDRPYVRFQIGGVETAALTYADTWSYSTRWAALLRDRGLRKGGPVLLALPNTVDFVGAFFGALLAGGLPATVAPMRRRPSGDPHVSNILSRLRFLRAGVLVLPKEQAQDPDFPSTGLPDGVAVVSSQDLPPEPEPLSPCDRETDLALLQFTSGTLGSAKAVELTHAALLAQLDSVSRALALDGAMDSAVSWLPFSHDMGLIGFLLTPAFVGGHVTLLQAEEFVVRPALWIRALSDSGATITGGPPSAYLLCARRIKQTEACRYDLSRLRVGLVGAEMVSRRSLRLFEKRFAAAGLRPTALTPTYGLAETCLAVTMAPLERGPEVESVDLQTLQEEGRAVRPKLDEGLRREFVSVGVPLWNTEIVIVDDDGKPLPERQMGEITVRSPSLMSGYRGDPLSTRQALSNGRLFTGDLGFQANGSLFITGRKKEILVVGGRNYYPEDLENEAATVPGVRRWKVVAVSYDDPDLATEEVVLMVETGVTDGGERQLLRRAIRRALIHADYPVSQVVLVPPKTFRTTPSGKLMRLDARRRFLAGDFGQPARRPESPGLG